MKFLEILWGIIALVIYKLALWPVLLIIEHIPLPHTAWWISFFIPLPKEEEYEMKRNGGKGR